MAADLPTGSAARRALIWSPSLLGHRLVYCRVIAGVLAELGCEVSVAAGLSGLGEDDRTRLELLRDGPVSEVVDVDSDLRARGPSLVPMRELATMLGAEVAVLTEADDALAEVAAWDAEGGLPTRLLALFIRSTNHQYARGSSGSTARRVLRRLRGTGGSRDEELQRRLAAALPSGVVPLVLDELYAAAHPATHRWLPDIYRDPDAEVGGSQEAREWADRVASFVAARDRPVFVYVGTNQHRRGYDTLLRLALEEDGCVAHCGRFELDGEPSDGDVEAMRATLTREGRLLETAGPYLDPATADVFLRAARCVVLPYRGHDGSSGVMLQALAAGRPVLVPDRGLMSCRVRGFGLGAAYADGDEGDLRRRFRELQHRGPEPFAAGLSTFMSYFERPQLVAALTSALTGEGEGARLPRPPAGAVAPPGRA
ncbi:MAG TPA: glycosyltransferase [Thermoleophilia bacterium]|nr:glycosyltransferase [Thermoleophilia bacterium]